MSQNGHRQVKINLDDHRGRQPVEMEELNVLIDFLLDEPTPSIFVNHLFDGGVQNHW